MKINVNGYEVECTVEEFKEFLDNKAPTEDAYVPVVDTPEFHTCACGVTTTTRHQANVHALVCPKSSKSSAGKQRKYISRRTTRRNKTWNAEETQTLIAMKKEGKKIKRIAKTLGRSYGGIAFKLWELRKEGLV